MYHHEGRSVTLVDATGQYGDLHYFPLIGMADSDNPTPYQEYKNETGYSASAYEQPELLEEYARLFFSRILLDGRHELYMPLPYWAADPVVDEVKMPVPHDGLYEHHMVLIPTDRGQDYRVGDVRFIHDMSVKPFGGHIEELQGGNWRRLDPEYFFNQYFNNFYGFLPRARPVMDILIPEFRKGMTDLAMTPLEAMLSGVPCPVSKYEEEFMLRSVLANGIIGASHLKEYENVRRITKGIRQINER